MRIRDMEYGQIGYIVPWSIRKYNDDLYVSLDTDVYRKVFGTAKMKIMRIGDKVAIDKSKLLPEQGLDRVAMIAIITNPLWKPDDNYIKVL